MKVSHIPLEIVWRASWALRYIFIYDYREEPEKAFWIHLDNGDHFFVNKGKVIVEHYEGGEYID